MVTITGNFLTGKIKRIEVSKTLSVVGDAHVRGFSPGPGPVCLEKLQTCRRTRPAEVRHMPEAAFGHLFRFHLLQMLSGAAAAVPDL